MKRQFLSGIKFLIITVFLILTFLLVAVALRDTNTLKEDVSGISQYGDEFIDTSSRQESDLHRDFIQVSFPQPGEEVGGKINVTGIAKGTWYFEGEFPIDLVDLEGKRLSSASAMAEGEWMTEKFVPFSASLKYETSDTISAKLILRRNNPSDILEQNISIEIPVTLLPEITSTKVFFGSRHLSPGIPNCDQVFSVARSGHNSMAYSHQTLEELFLGPTDEEKKLGYYTAIPLGVRIQSFDPSSRIAQIDLSRELLEMDVDVACRRIIMKNQIVRTIKESSSAEDVIITVDGKPFPGEFPSEGPEMR
jgi:hypothetical protein